MTNDEYKNYSLGKLNEFVLDALQSEATPDEIYNSIIKTIKDELNYHDVCKRHAEKLLNMLQGDRDLGFMTSGLDEYPYGESILLASDDTISFKTENDDVITFPKSTY